MRAGSLARILVGVAAGAVAACNVPKGGNSIYDPAVIGAMPPSGEDFFSYPWPSDARLKMGSDGKQHLDLTGFYDPGGGIGGYIGAVEDEPLDGFGTQAAIYFRFDVPLELASLPQDAIASVKPDSSVFLVGVTPGSPDYGKRLPLRAHFTKDAGNWIGTNWLALLPEPGFPLREHSTYTAVVTDGVFAADTGPLHRDPRFVPDVQKLDAKALGIDLSHVIVATTFTTQTATPIMKDLRDAVYAQAAAPMADMFVFKATDQAKTFDEYTGVYASPNFQEGTPPYTNGTGGHIHFGSDGKPEVVRTEMLRFAVTIPHGVTMPTAGWPVVLYAHGTGGDYESFIDDGSAGSAANVVDASGQTITHMAMISIDQVLHGPRDPTHSDPDLTFININNMVATRDNIKQGATDDFQLLRLVQGFSVAAAPTTGVPIKFDPDRIYFKGHSEGGLTGPLFLAYEPNVKAAILSGAGGGFIFSILGKTQPYDIPMILTDLLNEAQPIDEYHPLLNLLQVFAESSDPSNYGRLFFREPPSGMAAKSIYQSLGIVDHYTPIPNIKTLALATGLQPADPQLEPIATLPLTSLDWGMPPLMNNVASGQATGVLCEYLVPTLSNGQQRYDGHFVVFDDKHAVLQSNSFLGLHATTGTATLVP